LKYIKSGLSIILFVLIWQTVCLTGIIHPLVLPSPVDIAAGTLKEIRSGELPIGILYSFLMMGCAFLPAAVAAFLMALGARYSRKIDRLGETLSALAHPLPGIALLPLLILWTGLGPHIIIMIVFHSVLWPLYINLRSGFRNISPLWLDLGRNNQLGRRDIFLHILLPGAYPSILAGLKISWARAWRAVIAAEMLFGTIGSAGGLGWYIFNKRIFMDTPGLYSGILVLMLIGLLMDRLLFKRLEERMKFRWSGLE
jgi:NitT/TauT family transport system permease protein